MSKKIDIERALAQEICKMIEDISPLKFDKIAINSLGMTIKIFLHQKGYKIERHFYEIERRLHELEQLNNPPEV